MSSTLNSPMGLCRFLIVHNRTIVRAIRTFLDNTLVYLCNKKPSRGPLFVAWIVTYRCNAQCSFCSTHELGRALPRNLNTEEALNLIRQMGEAGVWHLSLTGGEPLVRKDLGQLIRESKRAGMIVNINTNGHLLAREAEMLVDAGIDMITISVDSDKSEVNDAVRVIPGLTQAIINGIEKVKSLRNKNLPEIAVRIVVSKQNYQDIDNIISMFRNKADRILLQPIHDGYDVPKFTNSENSTKTGLLHLKDKNPFVFAPEDRGKFATVFNKLINKHPWLNTLVYREFEKFFFDKDLMWDKYHCYAGFFDLTLDAFGQVYTCPLLIQSTGTVRENSLMNMWMNRSTQAWRRKLKNKENTCLCWCGTSQNNAYLNPIFESSVVRGISSILNRINKSERTR